MVTSDHLDYKQHSSPFTLCGTLLTPPGKCPKVSTVISDNVDVFTVKTDEYPETSPGSLWYMYVGDRGGY